MARPTKLTSELQACILELIEKGATYKDAAQACGIDETTLHRWKRQGEKAKSGRYYQFCQSLKIANEKAKLVLLETIGEIGAGGRTLETITKIFDAKGNLIRKTVVKKKLPPVWQACAWMLERRFPSEFGKHVQPQLPDERDPLQEWLDGLIEAESKLKQGSQA